MRIQIRRDTALNWYNANPVLYSGEFGYETDTKKLKIGTGSNWNSIDYFVYEDTKLTNLNDVTITSPANGEFLRYNGSASVWINDPINLATDTVGDYVSHLVQGTGLTIINNSGAGSTPTIGVTPNTYDAYGSASIVASDLIGEVETIYETIDLLTTTDIAESGNLYFTSQRAIDATVLSYDGVGSASVAEISAVNQANSYTDGRFSAVTLDDISNVSASTPSSGDFLKWNGTAWVNDAINLGTDTTGNYMSDLTQGTGVTITHTPGEGSNATIAIGQAVATSSSVTFAAVNAPLTGNVTGNVTGNADTATALDNARTISLTGDVSGSVSFDGTSDVAISATIQPNSVALGTDTTGDYVNDITAGTGVTVTHTPGEGSSPTIAIGQAVGTSASVTFADITVTGILALAGDPESALHAATKEYVDNVATGVVAKPSVLAATTTNIDATYANGTLGVGGTLTANSNGVFPSDFGGASGWAQFKGILVKNQTNKEENGRYFVSDMGSVSTPYVLTRCSYCDEASEIPGAYIFVQDGTLAGTGWIQVVADPATFVVGTDDIDVFQFSGAGTFLGGNGLVLTDNTFNVGTADVSRIVVNADNIDLATTGITAGEYNSVSVDVYGRVTSASVASYAVSSLDDIGDVSASTAVSGDFLKFNGAEWVNDPINLGTDTLGNYLLEVVAGTGLTVSHTAGEGSSASVSLNATLDDLSNVAAPSPSDGQFLKYVSASTAWVPAAIPTINALDDIGNVNAPSPSDGEFLKYVSASTAWVPAAIPTINALDDIGDVSASTPSSGQFLKWNGTAWVADSIPTINALDDIGDVSAPSPTTGEVLAWNGTAWADSTVVRDNLIRFYMEVM
jgi:hypothetical protein